MARATVPAGDHLYDSDKTKIPPATGASAPAAGMFFTEQNTKDQHTLCLNEDGSRDWVSQSTGQIIVGPPGSHAPFSSIKAAITSALVAGASAATPITVLIQPGTYTEANIVLTAGVYLKSVNDVLFTSPGDPPVTIVSAATVANVAGTIMLDGITLTHPTATPLTFGASAAVLLQAVNSKIINNSASAPTISISNSNVGSRFAMVGAKVINQGTAPALQSGAPSVSSEESELTSGGPVAFQAVDLGTVRFEDSLINGALATFAGGTVEFVGGTLNSSAVPNVQGDGTLAIADKIVAPFGISVGPLVSFAQVLGVAPKTRADLKGAGPFNLTAATLADYMVCYAGGTTTNLPDLATLVDGLVVTFKKLATVPGNTTLTAFGAQNIDGNPTLVLAPGDVARLQVQRFPAAWLVIGH